MEHKICTKCGQCLQISFFYKDSKAKTGYKSQCKPCLKEQTKERVAAWMRKYPEKRKAIYNASKKKREAKGLCKHCKELPLEGKKLCEKHYVADIANGALNKADNETVRVLLDRFYKNPVCPYTKEPLILGKNTHLDHILSKKNHPELSQNLDNVEWISATANMAKNGLDKDQFIELCRKITEVHTS